MIDWNKSAELNKCTIEWLKNWTDKYSKSNKRIAVICNICGDDSETSFSQYRELCNACSVSTPEAIEANRLRGVERCNTTEWKKKASDQMVQYNKDHPDKVRAHSEFMLDHCNKPEVKKANSEAHLNSNAMKIEHERQRGGNDLLWHHVSYDFLRSEALRVRITRKFHATIHSPKGLGVHQRGYSLID